MLLVGTSGFSYQHWRGAFYPDDLSERRWLEYYAERFPVVELNVTFYRLPSREQFSQWAERTPPGFRFVVKGSRQITHFHRLENVDTQLDRFFDAASALAEKLSVVLWQLPEKAEARPQVLATFCESARRSAAENGVRVRHAFEFRHPSWQSDEVTRVLLDQRTGLVQADPSPFPAEVEPTSDFAYLRFHHGRVEGVGYSDADLAPFVTRAQSWLRRGVDVYALFNNDPGGWAPRNAETFRALIEGR